MDRRTMLKGGLALSGVLAMPAYLRAQSAKKLSILTWNIADQEAYFNEVFADFKKSNPGVEIEWLDKKGPEVPVFYQTQLVAGTPPDIINTQGALWVEYAANGALMDITSMLKGNAEVAKRFNADYLANWTLDGKNFMLPFYITKTLLFYNKNLFKEAGITAPPTTFAGIMDAADKIAKGERTGLLTLNFDWLYWPFFKSEGVDLLTPDGKKAAFNTPKAAEVLARLAKGTDSGAINKTSWTGRWVEPNGAFAAGTVGMHHAHSPAFFFMKGQGPWINADTLGVAQGPGGWSTPNSHGLGISKGSKNPELAFALLAHMTSDRWTQEFTKRRNVLTGNTASDQASLARLRGEEPLTAAVLQTQLENTDKMTGNWPLPFDAALKDAFYPELQNAVLGRKDAKTALNDAERQVNRLLSRRA
ncbi:MAG TPA: sugar ABC transporter substrate-binding protein [Salinarimonas sp.]|nr:sugar ABC transporter substrate-binding protein [Salinarimonas sp.]